MKYVNPYNTVEFYVGDITEPQTIKIYTDLNSFDNVQVSEGNKWYTYVLPKDKGLCMIEGSSVKKVVVKANISFEGKSSYPYVAIIPYSTIEASFKGGNTIGVTNMSSMFYSCTSLTSLDVSNFDTSNVTYMGNMFNGCRSIKSLDLSNFNTSNVTDMNSMFGYCSNLTSLDVSNFDTSNVTNMNSMFSGCIGLTSLTLSNFNISKVTNMGYMFNDCRGLASLDLSGWNMSSSVVINKNGMFVGCSNLTSIRMVGCNQTTIDKIKAVMPSGASISTE